jgi:phosphatidate cytidylyltransferase
LLLPSHFSSSWKILFALLVNVAAQFGDLAESVLKRSCNVKDSAVVLPRVCGALDLIDSILLSAPVGFYLIGWAW